MKLEDQVVSLELAKKLKELGVRQGSYFYWREWYRGEYKLLEGRGNNEDIAAFTVAELGEILPSIIEDKGKYNFKQLQIWKHNVLARNGEWGITYRHKSGVFADEENIFADTEANARAKCLIYLIENGIVKP